MQTRSLQKLYLLVAIATISCASTPNEITSTNQPPHRVLTVYGNEITFVGGQGLSCSDPVIILGAPDDATCVAAQYEWIRAEIEDSRPVSHEGIYPEDGGMLSKIVIETPTGDRQVCFDISKCESMW